MDEAGAPDDPWDTGQDRTLPELLGPGAQEEPRAGLEWLAGLLAVLLFLGVTAYLFAEVLAPA